MWTDKNGVMRSALLRDTSSELGRFCYTCHGRTAQGADTNVEEGVYEARGSGAAFGEPGKPLNGGVWGPWKTPTFQPPDVGSSGRTIMSCDVCHNVHGSSNARLLQDTVLGVPKGGYDAADNPTPYVWFAEKGYPTEGFRKHVDYVAQGYEPTYTEVRHAIPPDDDPAKGLSGWCETCHDFSGPTTHFHPYNVPLSNWPGPPLAFDTYPHPIAHPLSAGQDGSTLVNTLSDWLECTSCHTVHNGHGNNTQPTTYPSICQECHNF